MKISLVIEKMHCNSCATTIETALQFQQGVKQAFVDYNKKEAAIDFDENQTSKEKILKVIEEMGYPVKEK